MTNDQHNKDMTEAVFVAMRHAFGVRQEPMTPGVAYKMAGELGQGMFGLNTWTEDKDEAGAAKAAQCRAVHDGVMEKVARTIRIQETANA